MHNHSKMIYLVTAQQTLFGLEGVTNISAEESLALINSWNMVQYDSETDGRDAHLNKPLCVQFGDLTGDDQVVVDVTTISILLYKDIFEKKYLIGQMVSYH